MKNKRLPSIGDMEQYIRISAAKRGINPDVAVRVAKTEGLQRGTWQSNVIQEDGRREPSYGPFQMHMEKGLGKKMLAETGVDASDPSNWQQSIDYALNTAAKKKSWGDWYGARDNGIPNNAGFGQESTAVVEPALLRRVSQSNELSNEEYLGQFKDAVPPLANTFAPGAVAPFNRPIPVSNQLVEPASAQPTANLLANARDSVQNTFPNGLTGLRGVVSDPNWQPSGITGLLAGLFSQESPANRLAQGLSPEGSDRPSAYERMTRTSMLKEGGIDTPEERARWNAISPVKTSTSAPVVMPLEGEPAVQYDPLSSIQAPTKAYDPLSSIKTPTPKPYDPLSSIAVPEPRIVPVAGDPPSEEEMRALREAEKATSGKTEEEILFEELSSSPTEDDSETGLFDELLGQDQQPPGITSVPALSQEELSFYKRTDPNDEQSVHPAARAAQDAGFGPGVLQTDNYAFKTEADKHKHFEMLTRALPGDVNVLNDAFLGQAGPAYAAGLGARNVLEGGSFSEGYDNALSAFPQMRANYAEQNPNRALTSQVLSPIPALVAATVAGKGAARAGLNALSKAAPGTSPAVDALSSFMGAESKTLPGRMAGRVVSGAAEGGLQGMLATGLSEDTSTVMDSVTGAVLSGPAKMVLDPFAQHVLKPLAAKATEGVNDLIQFAYKRLPDDVIPRADQITLTPEMIQAGTHLNPARDMQQVQRVTEEAARFVKATKNGQPATTLTKEVLAETEANIGKDLDSTIGKLGVIPTRSMAWELKRVHDAVLKELGPQDGGKYVNEIYDVIRELQKGPLTGSRVRGFTDSNSFIGRMMGSENGNDRRFGKMLYDVFDKGMLDFAKAAGKPALYDEMKELLLRYKNVQVLYDASNDNPAGLVNPRALKEAVHRRYGDKAELDPNNLLTTMARMGDLLPEVSSTGAVIPPYERTAQPISSAIGITAPPRPLGGASASVAVNQAIPVALHTGMLGGAAGAAGLGAAGWMSPAAAGAAIGIGLGGYGIDKLKQVGWRKLMADPVYRDWVAGYGRQQGTKPKLPAELNMLLTPGRMIPPMLVSGASYEGRRKNRGQE
jgi:hypothetical protein